MVAKFVEFREEEFEEAPEGGELVVKVWVIKRGLVVGMDGRLRAVIRGGNEEIVGEIVEAVRDALEREKGRKG